MFSQLQAMLRKGDSLVVTIALDTDPANLRVVVNPKLFTLDGENGPDRKAINQPLVVHGPAADFDSPAFIETLKTFATSVSETRCTLEDVTKSHKAAAEAARAKPAPTKPTPKPAAKPAAKAAPKPAVKSVIKKPTPPPPPSNKSWKDRVLKHAPAAGSAGAPAAASTIPVEVPAAAAPVAAAPKNASEATETML